MDIAAAPAAPVTEPTTLRDALALVDFETPGLDWAERAAKAYAIRDFYLAQQEAEWGPYDPDEDGSDAYVRHLELRGYDEARFQEQMEAQMGILV